MHGGRAGVGLTGGIGPGVPRRNIGVLRGNHMDVFKGEAERFRNHLGEGGIRALPDLGGAGHEMDRAVLIEGQARAARLHVHGIGGGAVAEGGDAHAPAQAASRACGLFVEGPARGPALVPAEEGAALFEAVADAEGDDGLPVQGREVAVTPGVLQAEVQRVHAERAGRVVHEAFDAVGRLRGTVAPVRPAHGDVAVKGSGGKAIGRMGIDVADFRSARRRDGMPVRGVGARVREHVKPVAKEFPVPGDGGARFHGKGMAHAGAQDALFAGEGHADGRAVELEGQEGDDGFEHHILLVAETAPDEGLDHPHGRPRDIQRLPDHAAADVRNLRRADHDDVAHVVHVGVGRLVFQMAMLHGGRAVLALDDEIGFGQGLFQPAVDFERVLFEEVALRIDGGLDERGVRRKGAFRRGHDGQRIVTYLDQRGGLARRQLVASHHHGHLVAVIAHVARQKLPVGHIPARGVHRIGVPGGGKEAVRHVVGGEDRLHAGQRQGFGRVDGRNHAVRDAAAHKDGVPHPGEAQIVGVAGPARHLGFGIQPLFGLSDGHAASPHEADVKK